MKLLLARTARDETRGDSGVVVGSPLAGRVVED
jgi:hypothetical protein